MYVAGYCLGRFWIELMRSDVATHIAGIRVNSFTSTFVFIGAVVYIMVAPKGREDPASLAGKPETVEEEEDTVEAFAKELTAVAATTGVVAAAKAAGDVEDEDAKAAVEDATDEKAEEPEQPEAEEPEAEDPEAEEPEAEAASEAESDEEPEAESEGQPEAGLGAVEGEEAVEAQEAAPEIHEAAVEAADEAEAVADEVAAEDEAAEAEEPEAEAEAASEEEPEAESDEEPQAEAEGEAEAVQPDAGLGGVEGEVVADEVAAEDAEPSLAAAAERHVEDVAEAPSEDIAEAGEFTGAGGCRRRVGDDSGLMSRRPGRGGCG
jgi:hypothetical protein